MAAPLALPDIHVTGAIHHWIQVRGDSNYYYLGTAEITPQMQRHKSRQVVMNDIWGKSLAAQKTYDGESATISCLLTRFSRTTWDILLRSGEAGLLNVAGYAGTETRISRGHRVFGLSDFHLWQVFDFALFPTVASANLELGWYWPQVTLEDHDTVAAGTQGEKLLLVMDAQPSFAGVTSGHALYYNDAAHFPADVLVPQ